MTDAIASSSAPEMDNIKTVELAVTHGFEAVQLYMDPRVRQQYYRTQLISNLMDTDLKVVLHLPNLNQQDFSIHPDDLSAAEEICYMLAWKDPTVLVHYEDRMTIKDIPLINQRPVAIENSKTRSFDPDHVRAALNLAREAGVPFVFDFGRILYARTTDGIEIDPEEIIYFIKEMIAELDPAVDVIHLTDKNSWDKSFRESACVFPEGINSAFIDELVHFDRAGGIIVWEFEDLEMTLASSKALKELQ